jgi:hypothetical protein
MRSTEVCITIRLKPSHAQVLSDFGTMIDAPAIHEMLTAAGLLEAEVKGYQVSYPQPHIAIVEPAAVAEGAAA